MWAERPFPRNPQAHVSLDSYDSQSEAGIPKGYQPEVRHTVSSYTHCSGVNTKGLDTEHQSSKGVCMKARVTSQSTMKVVSDLGMGSRAIPIPFPAHTLYS